MNVLHSNFLALVGDRCSRQKQVQHVQDIYEATAVLCGNSLLVVASQLKQIKKMVATIQVVPLTKRYFVLCPSSYH